jgi:hypothetical protein
MPPCSETIRLRRGQPLSETEEPLLPLELPPEHPKLLRNRKGRRSQDVKPTMLDAKVKFTWREILQIAVGGGVEIGVLSLISDSTFAVKTATVVVGVLGFLALRYEHSLEAIRRYSFITIVGILSAIYFCFVAYAIGHAWQREQLVNKLRDMYVAGSEIVQRDVPADKANPNLFDQAGIDDWKEAALEWETSSAQWIGENIGSAARSRFSDMSGFPSLCWGPKGSVDLACDNRSRFLNRIVTEEKNISALIEQLGAYSE